MDKINQYPGKMHADPRIVSAQAAQQQQQQQQQQRQVTQAVATGAAATAVAGQMPVYDDQAVMHARLKLDYMKSFQDDSHFFPEMANINSVVNAAHYTSHSPIQNFNNIQLQAQQQQQQQQHMPNYDHHPSFSRSGTPTGTNYMPQRQHSQKLSDRENLLSLLAQKNFEKQQNQFQHSKQHKRVASPHYHQHQQQGDPYLVN